MKTTVIAAAFALAFLAVSGAVAQTATITLSPADSTSFKAWVGTQKVVAQPAPTGFAVSVGAVVPQTITFFEIPMTVGISTIAKYRYAMIGNQIVLVDPGTRQIVYIVG